MGLRQVRVDSEMDSLLTELSKKNGVSKGVASKVLARRLRGQPFMGFDLTVKKKQKETKREQKIKFI